MNRLRDKIAFITGTGSGQGRAAALLFAAEGALVVGCDIDGAANQQTAELVRARGGRMIASAPVDLANPAAAKQWIDEGMKQAGGLDILYNNAAAARFAPIATMSAADWSFTLRNELDLVFNAVQAAWPHLTVRGGAIINIASTVAFRGNSLLGTGAHSAAKGGVISLTIQMAAEGAPHRIRVNCISPGIVRTPATAQVLEAMEDKIVASIPLRRAGEPEDIAYGALYLASDEARWVTGTNLIIDGGTSAAR